jgi:hypothetical protein
MKFGRILSALFVGVATATAVVAMQSPAGATGRPFPIQNYNGNFLCLQPIDGSVLAGSPIVQEPCEDIDAQMWTALPLGGNHYRYQNLRSGLCLDARGNAVNGTPIEQWTCNSISNEQWDTGGGVPDLVSLRSLVGGTHSHCLDIPGDEATIGLSMWLYACNGTPAQKWFVYGP